MPQQMLSVANTSSIGGGLRIVPHAEAFDGVLEIFQVRAMPRTRVARLFPLLMRAAHTEPDSTVRPPGCSISRDVNGDG
jgi:diacylglycerol kinase (ATP)